MSASQPLECIRKERL
jgi:hypothetical protein